MCLVKMWILIGFVLMRLFGITTAFDDASEVEQSGDFPSEDLINQFTLSLLKTKSPPPVDKFHSSLSSDINEFIDLIPTVEIKSKIVEFYRNDRDVQLAYDYFNGKEFMSLKKKLLDVREVREFVNYLSAIGLNIKDILHRIDGQLGITKIKPSLSRNTMTHTTIGGFHELMVEILALLPQDEIFILFFEKLDSSVEFANLVENIGSGEFGKRLESLKKCGELKILGSELHKHKIDIKKIVDLFQSYFFFGTF